MTDTNSSEGTRDITVALEAELAEVSQTTVAAAAQAAQNRDIATIMGQVMTVIVDANMRQRRSHKVSGDDCQWWAALVDYLTRPLDRQPEPNGKQRQN